MSAAFAFWPQFGMVARCMALMLPPYFVLLLMVGFERRHDCIGHLERWLAESADPGTALDRAH